MPVRRGKDINGPFYHYGSRGARYYYISGNKKSRTLAKSLAERQGRAIKYRQNLGKSIRRAQKYGR